MTKRTTNPKVRASAVHGSEKGEYWLLIATEHLRDGRESWHRLFDTKKEAFESINKYNNDHNMEFDLFEVVLRNKVKLKEETKEEPQPAKVTRRIVEA